MGIEIEKSSDDSTNVIVLKLASYRIIIIGPDDEIVDTKSFKSINDSQASTVADNMYCGLELDLWENDRHIKNIPARKRWV